LANTTPQPPRWTDQDLQLAVELAWQTGREHIPQGLAEAADDAQHWAGIPTPALDYEQRVAARHHAIRGGTAADRNRPDYRGGPVNWNAGPPIPTWLATIAARQAQQLQDTLDRGQHTRPVWAEGDWRAVHRDVSPAVWWRIWWDLTPAHRTQHADLAPQQALAVEAVMPQ
jgi:hypothetical protein